MHEGWSTKRPVAVGTRQVIGRLEVPPRSADWMLRVTASPRARVVVEALGAGESNIYDAVTAGASGLVTLGPSMPAARLVIRVLPDGVDVERATVDISWSER